MEWLPDTYYKKSTNNATEKLSKINDVERKARNASIRPFDLSQDFQQAQDK
jgi:hypothetical protein